MSRPQVSGRACSLIADTCVWVMNTGKSMPEALESDVKLNKANDKWAAEPFQGCTDEFGHTFSLGAPRYCVWADAMSSFPAMR